MNFENLLIELELDVLAEQAAYEKKMLALENSQIYYELSLQLCESHCESFSKVDEWIQQQHQHEIDEEATSRAKKRSPQKTPSVTKKTKQQ